MRPIILGRSLIKGMVAADVPSLRRSQVWGRATVRVELNPATTFISSRRREKAAALSSSFTSSNKVRLVSCGMEVLDEVGRGAVASALLVVCEGCGTCCLVRDLVEESRRALLLRETNCVDVGCVSRGEFVAMRDNETCKEVIVSGRCVWVASFCL